MLVFGGGGRVLPGRPVGHDGRRSHPGIRSFEPAVWLLPTGGLHRGRGPCSLDPETRGGSKLLDILIFKSGKLSIVFYGLHQSAGLIGSPDVTGPRHPFPFPVPVFWAMCRNGRGPFAGDRESPALGGFRVLCSNGCLLLSGANLRPSPWRMTFFLRRPRPPAGFAPRQIKAGFSAPVVEVSCPRPPRKPRSNGHILDGVFLPQSCSRPYFPRRGRPRLRGDAPLYGDHTRHRSFQSKGLRPTNEWHQPSIWGMTLSANSCSVVLSLVADWGGPGGGSPDKPLRAIPPICADLAEAPVRPDGPRGGPKRGAPGPSRPAPAPLPSVMTNPGAGSGRKSRLLICGIPRLIDPEPGAENHQRWPSRAYAAKGPKASRLERVFELRAPGLAGPHESRSKVHPLRDPATQSENLAMVDKRVGILGPSFLSVPRPRGRFLGRSRAVSDRNVVDGGVKGSGSVVGPWGLACRSLAAI